MADIRINSLPSTATSFNTDDYIAIDGASGGTRKMLAANPPFSDVTLGSSGPSVKSTLSARAPRQGLVFDGTGYGTFSAIPAFGTGDFTYAAWIYVPATVTIYGPGLIGGGTNSFTLRVFNNFKLQSTLIDIADNAQSTSTVKAGAWNFVTYRRSGTSGYYGINGVEDAAITDSRNYSVGCTLIGYINLLYGTNYMWNGSIAGSLVYNRALSASEVVALYEAGAPAGADYNSASGTTILSGTFVDGVDGTYYKYTTFSGASATGFTATSNSTGYKTATSPTAFTVVKGTKYLLRYTLTLNSGSAPKASIGDPSNLSYMSSEPTLVAGTNTIEFTCTTTASNAKLNFWSGAANDFSLSNVSLVRLGLLLAPDAAQAGGGLVWYDTSGNAANISWTSGVSWNVPSSQKTASGWAFGGNLTVSAASSWRYSSVKSSSKFVQLVSDSDFGNDVFWDSSSVLRFSNGTAQDGTGYTERARFTSGGNLLLKSDGVDSANGKLQLADHTTSAGGIGFGTDTSLYRTGTGSLAIDGGTLPILRFFNGATQYGYVYAGSSDGELACVTGPLRLKSNNTTALTLDSSQNATFAGKVGIGVSPSSWELNLKQSAVNSAVRIISPTALGLNDSSIYIAWASGSKALIAASYESTGSYRPLVLSAGGVDSLTLDISGNATFAGTATANGGIVSAGSPTGYSGGEFKSSVTTAGAQTGFSTFATGSPIMIFDHRGTSNTGLWYWRNGTGGGSNRMTLDQDGNLTVTGALQLGNAYQAGAPTATGYVTIKDSNGTTYKVPVGT